MFVKFFPIPREPRGRLLWSHPEDRVMGAGPSGRGGIRASWNVKETEPGAPSPRSKPLSKAVEKLLAWWREGSVRQKQAACAPTLCITHWRPGRPGRGGQLWEEQQDCRGAGSPESVPPSHRWLRLDGGTRRRAGSLGRQSLVPGSGGPT